MIYIYCFYFAGRFGSADFGTAARPRFFRPGSGLRDESGRDATTPPPRLGVRRPGSFQGGRHRGHQEASTRHSTLDCRMHPTGLISLFSFLYSNNK